MTPLAPSLETPQVQQKAYSIFKAQQQVIFQRTDRLIAVLIGLQWSGAILTACFLSPRTWSGTDSQIHPHVWAAIYLGGLISVFPILLALFCPGQALTRQVIAVAQLLMSALLIHVSGGRIATHFHIFGSLAILAFYRDWRVIASATAITVLDHLLLGLFWPQSVYGVASASLWLTVEHAGWVVFEDVFLLISCRQTLREMSENSLRQAQLEVAEGILLKAHETLERRVAERTAALEKMRRENETLLNCAGEGIYGIDLDGKARFVNPAAARMLGYVSAEIIGQPLHSLLHHTRPDGSVYPSNACPIYASMQTGEEHHIDYEVFWRKDGTSFAVEYMSTPLREEGRLIGAVVTFQDITERCQAAEALRKASNEIYQLHAELTVAYRETLNAYDATIEGLSRALDYRDQETGGHSERVTKMVLQLAQEMGLSEELLVHMRRGALLHDIGKMAVPDSILLKPGPLTDEERAVICRHADYAREMLWPIEFLRPALDIPYCHHEKWDGTGYPQGLTGEDIPLAARLFAIVDVWDALSSDRPYRSAWPHARVLDHLHSLAGTHFDPEVVPIFLTLLESQTAFFDAGLEHLALAA